VYSADPRVVPKARQLAVVSFDEMMEMASTGGRVLMLRSVEFARRHGVPLHVRSSFTWEPGTWIVEEDPTMEQAVVLAITDDTSEAKITVGGVPDRPGVAAQLFRELANRGINVDMIVQNTGTNGLTDISFTVSKTDLEVAREACDEVKVEIGAAVVTTDDDIGRVSVIGAGMKSSPGVTALMFETLFENGINIEMISTSSIRISCVLRADRIADAVRHLHTAFGLDAA
jgi:aspartate kinase